MKTTYPSELSVLQANAGSPIDLARIQNEALRLSLEEVRVLLTSQSTKLSTMLELVQRRTAVLSPAKAYTNEMYARTGRPFPLTDANRELTILNSDYSDERNP
jgi:hypothetical protein